MTPLAPVSTLRRLASLVLAVTAAWVGFGGKPAARAAEKPVVVTMLGDSITAGYGLAAADALPAQLGLALNRLGVKAEVRGAGVSGDTTADGLGRVDFSVLPDTRLCIVALGANDLLQGVDPGAIRANLTAILERLKARRIPALLVGIRAPAAIGPGYARDYNALFPTLARQMRAPLYPDLLAGAENQRALTQADGLHPNAAGAKVIAARLAPAVAKALRAPS